MNTNIPLAHDSLVVGRVSRLPTTLTEGFINHVSADGTLVSVRFTHDERRSIEAGTEVPELTELTEGNLRAGEELVIIIEKRPDGSVWALYWGLMIEYQKAALKIKAREPKPLPKIPARPSRKGGRALAPGVAYGSRTSISTYKGSVGTRQNRY